MSRLRVFGGHRLCLLWGSRQFWRGPHFLCKGIVLEWLDYADCAGDDPLKWDLDHVVAVDVQEYARKVCSDCPVRRECAAHAIGDRSEVGRIFDRVVAASNADNPAGSRVEPEGEATARQVGVIRGGVALVDEYEPALYAVAGLPWHGFADCTSCGRALFKGNTPHSERPAGSVRYARSDQCSSCAYGKGLARLGGSVASRPREAWVLRERGMSVKDIAEDMGVTVGAVYTYLRRARNGEA